MMRLSILLLFCCVIAVPVQADKVEQGRVGRAVERHLPSDEDFMQWVIDAERLKEQAGDRLEVREVVMVEPQTVKLDNIVPPIHFESGIAQVPDSTVQELRTILEKMRHRVNVRLNLVGHTDDQPLSAELAMVYGDNEGLSRERAGQVAEFIQTELGLPSEAISYEWTGALQPIASNATDAGRALNRRVEVEVWYDELNDKVAQQEYVVSEEIGQIKVCRMETGRPSLLTKTIADSLESMRRTTGE